MDQTPPPAPRNRSIYLLPNLFTTAALFSGFFAIIAASQGRFEAACIAIFVAAVLDGVDGRVARMTNTQSEFGVQYDSLSDLISFGMAPALVMYHWALVGMKLDGPTLGKIGWLAAFIYATAAALRLARFNTMIGTADKRFFQGLPSPSAAAIVAAGIWIGADQGISGADVNWLAAFLTTLAGLLMVSNFRYRSFKDLDLRNRVPFVAAVIIMLGFALVYLHPPVILFLGFLTYALSGPLLALIRLQQKRARRREQP